LVIGVLLVAIAMFALDKLVWNEPTVETSQSAGHSTAIKQTIAVLPFANFSADEEQEYFSDGLTEELLNLLTRVTDLRVIGRTSSFKFKNENEDLREIGRQLGAGYLLEGSVRRYDDNLRVTAQLIDTSTGALAGARGEIGEALMLTRRSRQLDPLNLAPIHDEAFLNYLGRDYEKAEAGFREALEAAKSEPGEPMRLGALSLVYHALGEQELAEETFTKFRERYGGRAAVPVAGNYAQRGKFDTAFAWYERAYEQRDAQLLWTLSHPVNDVVRDDPRFDAFIDKLKLREKSSE